VKRKLRTQAIITSQDLNDTRREELLGKLDNFDGSVRGERPVDITSEISSSRLLMR